MNTANKRKKRIILNAVLTALVSMVLVFSAVVVFAYFSTRIVLYADGGSQYFRMGMELNTFFDQINSGSTAGDKIAAHTNLKILCTDKSLINGYSTSTASAAYWEDSESGLTIVKDGNDFYYAYNEDAEWGSASNPYIISKINHLQNLYVLQNSGYFTTLTDEGTKEDDMPYFLVCKSTGETVTIDGTDKEFEYIGNDDYPFIGYVGGAFVDGNTTVNGQTSDQSVIYNLTAVSKTDVVDSGMFGNIGYLGNDSTMSNNQFSGAAATVCNLLLYDVKVQVNQPDSWSLLVNTLSHRLLYDGSDANTPHENRHVGILAGHVEYATIQNISVYYSSDSAVAIDVSQTMGDGSNKPNFMSASGILGYVHEMNSEQKDGKINVGTGVGTTDIVVSGGGVGTGGGGESGTGSGYVSAASILNANDDSGQIIRCTIPVTEYNPDGTTFTTNTYKYGLLIYAKVSGSSVTYTLSDETTAVSLVNVSENSVPKYVARITNTYTNFFGISTTSNQDWEEFVIYSKDSGSYGYYKSGATTLTSINPSDIKTVGVSLRYASNKNLDSGEFERLCVQYERERTVAGTQTTDRCYFYDGVFTFALSDPGDSITETWGNETADNFYVGNDSASDWKTNTSEGNKAVVSYIKQVTSTTELKQAVNANKPLYLMHPYTDTDGSTQQFLVTLAGNSTFDKGGLSSSNDSTFTMGTSLSFVDSATSEQLKQSVASGTVSSPIAGVSNTQLVNNWSSYKILDVGNAKDSSIDLEKLRTYYNVDVAFKENTADTAYKDDQGNTFPPNSNVSTPTSGSQLTESVTYKWPGYMYFESEITDTTTILGQKITTKIRFVLHYVDNKGKNTVLQTTSSFRPTANKDITDYSVTKNSTQQYGATTYTYGSYTAPLFFYNSSTYYSSWERNTSESNGYKGSNAVTISNNIYSSQYAVYHNYYTADTDDNGTIYKWLGSGDALTTPPSAVYTGSGDSQKNKTTTIGGVEYNLYNDGVHGEAILLSRNISSGFFIFSSTRDGETYTLRLQRRAYTNSFYSIMCGTDAYAENGSNFKNAWNQTASVTTSKLATVAPIGDGSFYISYTVNGNTYYLSYGTVSTDTYSGTCFHSSQSANNDAKMYIYTVEGSQDINYGHVTYEPKGTQNSYKEYSASGYVLWPNQAYDGTDATSSYKPSSTGYTTDPTYTVKSLTNLLSDGWKNSFGNALGYSDLKNVFSLNSQISQINLISIGQGNTGLGSDQYVRAPIGTTGEEAYIPCGCVAFRVNQSGAENKVRVIVAVPSSEYYYGQSVSGKMMNPGDIDFSNDYYFCMWKCAEAGSEQQTTISIDNCIQAFELPRSNPYQPGSNATDGDYYSASSVTGGASANSVKKYINITDNGTTKRSYLNGSVVLVAYEFTATEEGVYLLGSNHECQIVFFSADATSSEGKDGTVSYKIGSIDFVYDNGVNSKGNKIITITNNDPDTDGTFYYTQYYYPSLTLLYTDNLAAGTNGALNGDTDVTNGFPNINDFTISVRRYLTKRSEVGDTTGADGTASEIAWTAGGGQTYNTEIADASYLLFSRYSLVSDLIIRNPNVKITR